MSYNTALSAAVVEPSAAGIPRYRDCCCWRRCVW